MSTEETKSLIEEASPVLNEKESSQEPAQNVENADSSNSTTEKTEPIVKPKPNPPSNSDTRKMTNFLSPMLNDLEKIMAENMKQLDKLEEDLLGKSERANLANSHIPEAIRERKSIETIMKNLQELIFSSSETEENSSIDQSNRKNRENLQEKLNRTSEIVKEKLNKSKDSKTANNDNDGGDADEETSTNFANIKIDKVNNIICLAHSLSAYIITANSLRNSHRLRNLTIKLYDAVNLWLSRLFRFYDSSVLFHDQEPEGIIRMCNILLNFKYPDYAKNGYQSISRQPAIYISGASKYAILEYRELIAIQLGLPLTSIKLVPVSKVVDYTLDKIDISLFVKQVEEDLKAGFAPLLIVANAGSYSIGQCDDIQQIYTIAIQYKMWLHLDGIYLSTLPLYSVPTAVQPVSSGDSITIDFGSWIGLPSLRYVPFNNALSTLHRCLPYWCVLQAIGHDGVMQRIKHATDISYYIDEILKKHKLYIKVLDFKGPKSETTVKFSFGDLISKALSFLTFVDLNNPIVLFKCNKHHIKERLYLYDDSDLSKDAENNEHEKNKTNLKQEFLDLIREPESYLELNINKFKHRKSNENESNKADSIADTEEINEYTDTLTTWLCELLNSLHKKLEFELIEIENEGICIRYSPLEHANIYGVAEQDVYLFDKSMEEIIQILDASIKCKSIFDKEIKQFKNLIPVYSPKWAGVGAVRYIPDDLLDQQNDIINHLKIKNNQKQVAASSKVELENESNETAARRNKREESDNHSISSNQTLKEENNENEKDTEDKDVLVDENKAQQIEKYVSEIDDFNEQLVKKLQDQDGAFSIGEAFDGIKAIRFGMVTELTDLAKLASQVQDVGKNLEESTRYLDKMTEIILQGIEKANEDLRKENEAKIVQQGILRQIPIVGGLFSWWASAEPQTIPGRSFNLQSGKIASTEITYKYHMQVEESNNGNEKSDSEDFSRKSSFNTKSDRGDRRHSTISTGSASSVFVGDGLNKKKENSEQSDNEAIGSQILINN